MGRTNPWASCGAESGCWQGGRQVGDGLRCCSIDGMGCPEQGKPVAESNLVGGMGGKE